MRTKLFKHPILAILLISLSLSAYTNIPLPEHPRPDHWRTEWINLNGAWAFQFDPEDQGLKDTWFDGKQPLNGSITVPFSWGAPLSGVEDEADIGWYERKIEVPVSWEGKRIYLVVGASDWQTQAWIDGQKVGEHRGGYTPFEFELTDYIQAGKEQSLTIRVDDTGHGFKLEGKQGYGKARGIWQTTYLEARGTVFTDHVHIAPDIDKNEITISGSLSDPLGNKSVLNVLIKGESGEVRQFDIPLKKKDMVFEAQVDFPDARLWTLDDPHLYSVVAILQNEGGSKDALNTYFGMRKIGVADLPGTDYPYITLNNKPLYLQLALDQAYHPEGFYTFPSDDFVRDEIIRSKKIGLNGQRIHVKIGSPRKLFWADKLGFLIMADVPNSWGEPDSEMRFETEKALRGMIKRDYNHPSVFSWIIFNETWGLFSRDDTNKRHYLPETQEWVREMYGLAKSLDPTRLVEDNSACNYDHVATDLNTWHAYLPGYKWKDFLANAVENTYEGSEWNYAKGYTQGRQPMLNSECGNVWGYQGSTGDVDWSWDYHIMINEFRLQPKIAGWLYTEHHDVINEWNGYYKYDRSEKYTGLEGFNGMSINDLHSLIQITPEVDLMSGIEPGESIEIPLWLSILTDHLPARKLSLKYHLQHINAAGFSSDKEGATHQDIEVQPWHLGYLDPLQITAPEEAGTFIVHLELVTEAGDPVHKNFVLYRVESKGTDEPQQLQVDGRDHYLVSFEPDKYARSSWSQKEWNVLEGKKVNGAGYGYFEYEVDIPGDLNSKPLAGASFRVELSAKELFGKDQVDSEKMEGDYMRGRGTHDPSRNPNAYPMTDNSKWSSYIRISINGKVINEAFLPDDPADHRGVLSWFSQLRDNTLKEAGSYGYLIHSPLPDQLVRQILEDGKCTIRIEVPDIQPGGVAVYGKDFGRYPLDPTLVFY